MSERSDFLRCFTPVPEGAALPERISSAYDAESCLRRREDGGWTLRLRRRADGALYVLKADPAGNEDLPGEFQILTRLSPLLSGAVPGKPPVSRRTERPICCAPSSPGRRCGSTGSG